ncbi:MAG: hypothetical protein NTZ60_11970 [Campylobacterales bacterium]|nr:hypothetical protein [Campylobacterales bacterium]
MASLGLITELIRYLAHTYPVHRAHFYKNRAMMDRPLRTITVKTSDTELVDIINNINNDFFSIDIDTAKLKADIFSAIKNRTNAFTTD